MSESIGMEVNGTLHRVVVDPGRTLLSVLREELKLTGTKYGCGEGACGACTVILNGAAVKSCSVLAVQADGAEILTVEGLAHGADLHPLQKAFLDYGAFQCGFCTPGMLMSAKALLDETPHPTQQQIKEGIDGNVCRCTGYNSIIRAITAVARGEYKEAK